MFSMIAPRTEFRFLCFATVALIRWYAHLRLPLKGQSSGKYAFHEEKRYEVVG